MAVGDWLTIGGMLLTVLAFAAAFVAAASKVSATVDNMRKSLEKLEATIAKLADRTSDQHTAIQLMQARLDRIERANK